MRRAELRQLVDSLLEGDINEADFVRLEAELSVDEELRREFLDRMALDMLLSEELASNRPPHEVDANSGFQSLRSHPSFLIGLGALAAILLLAVFVISSRGVRNDRDQVQQSNAKQGTTSGESGTEPEAAGFAIISGQENAQWDDGQLPVDGSLIPVGRMRLARGIVQLEFFSGVSVVVEGPAEFSVDSAMDLTVQRGKVRALVPEPAKGFRLSTPNGLITDLGTDFAVQVDGSQSELHVLQGEVELQKRDKTTVRYLEGQAVQLSNNNQAVDLNADRSRFVGHFEVARRFEESQQSKRRRWLQWSEQQLQTDRRLVALYQIGRSEPNNRQLTNFASGNGRASEGTAVAAARTTDRWNHDGGGLDFSPTGSSIRLNVPSELQSITLLCWVKINSLDRWYNSLFLTDGHEQHEPHWQIMDDGRLFFSVKKRDKWDAKKGEKDKHIYYSPSFWQPSLSGQWLMLATTYDIKNKRVRHYFNGKLLSTEKIPIEYLVERVRINNGSIGNWSLPERDEPRFAVRNLNGSFDEFALFNEALSADEIMEMYQRGKP